MVFQFRAGVGAEREPTPATVDYTAEHKSLIATSKVKLMIKIGGTYIGKPDSIASRIKRPLDSP